MRGILAVEDFIKLAAGLAAGLFVLAVIWVYVSQFISTDCWKSTFSPFDDALLGIRTLQAPLGSKESFIIPLNMNSKCLQSIYFLDGNANCGFACTTGLNSASWYEFWTLWHDNKYASSVVNDCMVSCQKYCTNKQCIMLMPLPGDIKTAEIDIDKPKIYGSGDYLFHFGAAWSWSRSNDKSIKPEDEYKCLIFKKLSDGKTYQVTPSNNAGDCK